MDEDTTGVMEEKSSPLQQIAAEINQCQKCILCQARKKAVPGAGPPNAQIMFIGEGPGFHENEQGLPFVGAAGKFLDELLAGINLQRSDVFITNVVKCRPPGNRDPEADELAACDEYLERQIEAINPKVIVTLGRFSMAKFVPNVKITQVHGKPRQVHGRLVVPMFHPAAALHQGSLKPLLEQDFKRLPEMIASAAALPKVEAPRASQMDFDALPPSAPQPAAAAVAGVEAQIPPQKPVQLSLF